jgi:hypothetical protein
MCFSAEMDVVAGVAVAAIGIDAYRHADRPAEKPLAAIPLVFAGHQLVEAVVWRGLEGDVSASVWRPALWIYLAIAFGVLPVLVPIAVGALEPVANRWRVNVLAAIGVAVAAVLMFSVVRGPVDASIEGHHIAYSIDLEYGGLVVMLYVAATCGSMLLSRVPHVRWFGVINLVAVGVLAWLTTSGLISLWCLWAAVTSVAIAVHLRSVDRADVHADGEPVTMSEATDEEVP